ncbi:hypothetical protein [Streptomyces alkaliterrae]|uniref:Uncharacterized protein n=1 Tax=Streptomyces alkaliterrae TaxID=2213162 RepID=A0A7W3ZSN8_9ACTN|nr:hypothetical protein [Streptomyces alkaliterrae]MBB1259389.1 hypothetical protein [Streptomyces alkaliterrae]
MAGALLGLGLVGPLLVMGAEVGGAAPSAAGGPVGYEVADGGLADEDA